MQISFKEDEKGDASVSLEFFEHGNMQVISPAFTEELEPISAT